MEIEEYGVSSSIVFENDIRLVKGEVTSFESETGQKPMRRTEEINANKPQLIFNLIDRAAKETGLNP